MWRTSGGHRGVSVETSDHHGWNFHHGVAWVMGLVIDQFIVESKLPCLEFVEKPIGLSEYIQTL